MSRSDDQRVADILEAADERSVGAVVAVPIYVLIIDALTFGLAAY